MISEERLKQLVEAKYIKDYHITEYYILLNLKGLFFYHEKELGHAFDIMAENGHTLISLDKTSNLAVFKR